jgi:phosphomannomutase
VSGRPRQARLDSIRQNNRSTSLTAMEIPSSLMVSVSGVRGRIGDGLTPEIVAGFAAAFGLWARRQAAAGDLPRVVVGRDSRVSGPMLSRAVISALQSVGVHVIDVGLSTTPTIQMAVESHHACGGLAITASHNPVEWNALKFIAPSGLFLDAAQGREMRSWLDREMPRAAWDALGEVSEDNNAIDRHIEAILSLNLVNVDAIRARVFRVALDSCRGSGSVIMLPLLNALGCEVHPINAEPDGRFPRSPEPVAENLGELENLVKRVGADVGMAVDPDVDRLALVSETGTAIGEDYTLALAARVVLGSEAEARGTNSRPPVVTNLSTSRVLDDVASTFGTRVVRAPVGEVNVAVKMRETGARVGGEGNGGVILSDLHLGRDAPLAAALVLQLLARENRSLSAIVGDYPRYVIVKDKVDRPLGSLAGAYDAALGALPGAEVDRQDGLRLAWADRWVHLRPSGTEPIVRIIAEAENEKTARDLIAVCKAPLRQMASRE